MIHKAMPNKPTSGDNMIKNGIKLKTICRTNSAPEAIVDCIAWNRTNLFSFSMTRKTIPETNPSR